MIGWGASSAETPVEKLEKPRVGREECYARWEAQPDGERDGGFDARSALQMAPHLSWTGIFFA